ncbi:MAG: adenylate/guanylate cyclase domain-containing protein [Bacteroidota bacterium]|nr:adenylate/guanylate cyclase domain-containing protein [Bacteroidota bacterium]
MKISFREIKDIFLRKASLYRTKIRDRWHKRDGYFFQLKSLFIKDFKVTVRYTQVGLNYIVEMFLRLQIRLKLSIIVAASIIGTTLIIGTIVTQLQERELRLQTEALGHSIMLGLNSSAKDNLLLNSPSIIQDYVNNFKNLKLQGLEHLFIIDRKGVVIAHLVSDELNKRISAKEWDVIARTDSSTLIETSSSLRFVQAIVVNKREGKLIKKIIVGGASISFSKETLLAKIGDMKFKIFLYSFIVSLIAIGLVFYVSKHIVRIIIVLSDAARKVGSGNLQVNVATRMKDELGMLSRDFNFMVVQIREKVEMQKFVSKSTVEMISTGKEMTLGGTRSLICAMFTDIRGFTSFSENKSPEEVVETLNHYLDLQTRVIHEHGGVVDKFLGDGIMSIFRGERMTSNAIEASIHIQKEVALLNIKRKKQKENVLNVGVGIASGIAVLGSVGSHDRMDFTAIGDTVNLSSRLCGIAGPMEIIVTDEIALEIKKLFPSVSQGNIPIKGKKQEVAVHKINYTLN